MTENNTENNYDLEEKINLLYDYLYNQTSKNTYTIDKIELGKIGLDNIKIAIPEENKEEIEYYNLNKESILRGKFKIIFFNSTLNHYVLKKISDEFSVMVKISFYNKLDTINSFDSLINNDSLFSYLLSQLVLTKKTKHILLPIMNLDIKLSEIKKYISHDEMYNNIELALKNNKIVDIVCLQVREHYYSMMNLEKYLKEKICNYKLLLFQLFHTLACVQQEFTGFRHNNLKVSNVYLYLKINSNAVTEYNGFKNDIFYVPNTDFDIKITNFEYSIIPKYHGLVNLQNKHIKFPGELNAYYDIFTFVNNLIPRMSSDSINSECNKGIIQFLNKVVPDKIRGNNGSNFVSNVVITNPIDLLYDDFFKEYTIKPAQFVTTPEQIFLMNRIKRKNNNLVLGNHIDLLSNSNIMINTRTIYPEKSLNKVNKKIKRNINNMTGGYEKTQVQPYKTEKNSPFVSNDMQNVKKKSYEGPKEPPVLIEQKIYDTSKVKPEPQQYPPFIPINQMGFNNYLPYGKDINQPNVTKTYNVSLSNPISNYTSINRIYEDVLIGHDPNTFTFTTVYERIQLIDYLYNNIIEKTNGEEMDITASKNSLLEYIKLDSTPNPYTVNKAPLQDLPRNFLLYRAGYPIKYDIKSKLIGLNKDSMGVNVRIYMMTIGDYRAKALDSRINPDNFDLWREMKYYDWVRQSIINKKVSPNFIAPILWKVDTNSKIDWKKLDEIKLKNIPLDSINKLKFNQKLINNKHKLPDLTNLLGSHLNKSLKKHNEFYIIQDNCNTFKLIENNNINTIKITNGNYTIFDIANTIKQLLNTTSPNKWIYDVMIPLGKFTENSRFTFTVTGNNNIQPVLIIDNSKLCKLFGLNCNIENHFVGNTLFSIESCISVYDFNINVMDITFDSGKNLILLTEAPTSSIKKWASPTYEKFGTVRRMITTGYHTDDVWKSVLFQLIYACAVLEKSSIYLPELSLDNVYIKDIFSNLHSIGSWIYKINNIDYYVPNYGYVVALDSNYRDIELSSSLLAIIPKLHQQYKIYSSTIFSENSNFDISNIQSLIFNQFKEMINPDNFSNKFRVEGVNPVTDDIRKLLSDIYNDKKCNDIISLIHEYFTEFVHNKVGILLSKNEKEQLDILNRPIFTHGNLMAYQVRYMDYMWAIYCKDIDNLQKEILIKENGKYKRISVFNSALYEYSEKINPESTAKMQYDENHIYETYNFDKLIK